MSYHLFLDDERQPKDVVWLELPPVNWVVVKNYNTFVAKIMADGIPSTVSFDHDLADEHYAEYKMAHDERMISRGVIRYDNFKEKTGYECAKFLAQLCVDRKVPLPIYYIHTLNPIGRENIQSIMASARKMLTDNK